MSTTRIGHSNPVEDTPQKPKQRGQGVLLTHRSGRPIDSVCQEKVDRLCDVIAKLESVVVAFSGGVDSTLLLTLSLQVLGENQVLAATADSPTLPRSELAEAVELAKGLGAKHVVIGTRELQDECFASNPTDRCYYCKQELFAQLRSLADRQGYKHVAYGATAADLGDHRPGMRAATEAGAVAPLLEAGFTKRDVRILSRQLDLPTWNKPAMACLSSRFPYGTRITEEKLLRVEKAEELLRQRLGFREVRVRDHDSVARIEILPEDSPRLVDEAIRDGVISQLKKLGYTYVALDLEGFRSGSMNESAGAPVTRVPDARKGHATSSSRRS